MTRCDGFTILEMMVALVVAGIIMLSARSLFSAVSDGGTRLRAARAELDQAINARRLLQGAFAGLDMDDGTVAFVGTPTSIRCRSWLETPEGWFERTALDLEFRKGELRAIARGDTVLLAVALDTVAFDYLSEPGRAGAWLREWTSPVSPPFAVRLRTGRRATLGGTVDTTLFLIGSRG